MAADRRPKPAREPTSSAPGQGGGGGLAGAGGAGAAGGEGDAIRRSWDSNADGWTAAVRGDHMATRTLVTNAAIVEAVADLGPRRVLDVGCGEGWLARELACWGMDVSGIDGSAALIEAARSSAGGSFEVCTYQELVADPERIEGGYDVAVCNFSLLDETLAPLLAAIATRLSAGGALVIQSVHPWSAREGGPYQDGWKTETFAALREVAPFVDPMPWYFRTLESWVSELNRAGLAMLRVREPVHPETGEPASLLITARVFGSDAPQ